MSTIERLNAKKAVLFAQRQQIAAQVDALGQQREQAIANLNATIGAIALCDEMIAEEGAALVAEAAKTVANEPPAPAPEMPAVVKDDAEVSEDAGP